MLSRPQSIPQSIPVCDSSRLGPGLASLISAADLDELLRSITALSLSLLQIEHVSLSFTVSVFRPQTSHSSTPLLCSAFARSPWRRCGLKCWLDMKKSRLKCYSDGLSTDKTKQKQKVQQRTQEVGERAETSARRVFVCVTQ